MQSSFADRLVNIRPRETGGVIAANRFEYQRSWALYHLLSLHRDPNDYLLLFEHHDDIVVLNSSANPTEGDFYQIKTKSGTDWKISELIQLNNAQNNQPRRPSILGRLTHHKILFSQNARTLNLVSNQCFRRALSVTETESDDHFLLKELDPGVLARVLAAIREEHGVGEDFDCSECMRFWLTELPIGSHKQLTVGALAEYLEERYPGARLPVIAAYQALCDEIARKSTRERQPTSFEELDEQKGISRARFERFIAEVGESENFQQNAAHICQHLLGEGLNWFEVSQLRRAINSFEIDRMDQTNLAIVQFASLLKEIVGTTSSTQVGSGTLRELHDAIRVQTQDQYQHISSLKSPHYASAMVFVSIYEA